ncbi:YtxH domain-containing protein [Bacillus sp. MUM 13]|uniref:YtxH domain-containing protein n=1 Tax=Bacillus sp. MUM 13 TaxID=1678001 RepID=UPI0009F46F6C|nr:YtxH domain-containing protein [Bacillus sp. MUM 13]
MTQKEYQPKEYTRDYQKTYEADRESSSSKDFIIGALVGGMVGAATALFMAPKAGKELRSDFNVQAKNISDKTIKLSQAAMERGTTIAGTAKDKTSTVSELVTSKSADLMNKVKSLKTGDKETGSGESNATRKTSTGTQGESSSPITSVETSYNSSDNASSGSSADLSSGNKNAAQLKLDETKKAFEETENKYNK